MKLTKFGHCCILIEESGLRILTDPGSYTSDEQLDEVKNIDVVLITHEHGDHFHVESLKKLLKTNPKAKVYTIQSVGSLMDAEKIVYKLLQHGDSIKERGISIEGFGEKHAEIHSSIPLSGNTGYFINNKFFYPGDNFTDPGKKVDVLAVPVAGPWMRVSEGVDYALKIKPRICFPVHDGTMSGTSHRLPANILPKKGVEFVVPEIGKEMEI